MTYNAFGGTLSLTQSINRNEDNYRTHLTTNQAKIVTKPLIDKNIRQQLRPNIKFHIKTCKKCIKTMCTFVK